jgi:hypothetical protein
LRNPFAHITASRDHLPLATKGTRNTGSFL